MDVGPAKMFCKDSAFFRSESMLINSFRSQKFMKNVNVEGVQHAYSFYLSGSGGNINLLGGSLPLTPSEFGC
jgi:hypothetical protein